MHAPNLILLAVFATTLPIPALAQDPNDVWGPPPTRIEPTARDIEDARSASEAQNLVGEGRYADALRVAEALVGTKRESSVLESRLLANLMLGRLDEARRIFAAEVPPLGSADDNYSDRSGAGLPLMRGIQGYLEAKAGRCPAPLWTFLTEEFYGDPPFTKLSVSVSHGIADFLTEVVPTDPSPRTLEFLMIFEIAGRVGPLGRETLYRRAVALYPDCPVGRIRLAEMLVSKSGCLVEPDGTVATPGALPVATPNQQAAFYAYMDTLSFLILDEAVAREILAHYRIALRFAPSDQHYRKHLVDAIWIWEGRLGIRR